MCVYIYTERILYSIEYTYVCIERISSLNFSPPPMVENQILNKTAQAWQAMALPLSYRPSSNPYIESLSCLSTSRPPPNQHCSRESGLSDAQRTKKKRNTCTFLEIA